MANSYLRPRPDRQGQDRNVGSVRHRPGWQIQKADQNCAKGTQPRMERKVLFVSSFFNRYGKNIGKS